MSGYQEVLATDTNCDVL